MLVLFFPENEVIHAAPYDSLSSISNEQQNFFTDFNADSEREIVYFMVFRKSEVYRVSAWYNLILHCAILNSKQVEIHNTTLLICTIWL